MRISFKTVFLVCVLPLLVSCGEDRDKQILEGETMGTYYRISVLHENAEVSHINELSGEIQKIFFQLNKSLSTWDETSLISRFNKDADSLDVFKLDKHFATVTRKAKRVFEESGGAFNPTLEPLIKLWGFGNEEFQDVPSVIDMEESLKSTNFRTIIYNHDNRTIRRERPGVRLNYSAIAKGYAVDVVTRFLMNRGYKDFLVDIGGEIYARGMRAEDDNWAVAIKEPSYYKHETLAESFFRGTYVNLKNAGIATSGDYNNFRLVEGERVHHIIDPRYGKPAKSRIASASVVASSAAYADAWATALVVMGKGGINKCTQYEIACMTMTAINDRKFEKSTNALWITLERERTTIGSRN